MIEEVDEALRRLLVAQLPITNGDVDIQFDQPKREWSARVSRPTINLFLYDLRENLKLRHTASGWDVERTGDGQAIQRRRPFRTDLHYLITAWVRDDPEGEHSLLSRILMALFRVPELPDAMLPPGLRDQPGPIPLKVAQYDTGANLTDVWSAMDNELRPAIVCVVTVAMNPYQPITGPAVRTRELRVGQSERPWIDRIPGSSGRDGTGVFWSIGGAVHTPLPLDTVHLALREKAPPADLPLIEPLRPARLAPAWLVVFEVGPAAKEKDQKRKMAVQKAFLTLQADLKKGKLEESRQQFLENGISLSDDIVITATVPGAEWTIEDPAQARTYRVAQSNDTLGVYEPGGRFTVGNLAGGQYTAEFNADGGDPCGIDLEVPAPDYDLEFDGLAVRRRTARHTNIPS